MRSRLDWPLGGIVLLVDDSTIQVASRQAILEQAGFEVRAVTDVESALALIRTEPFRERLGVVLTDHIMPGATGAEFVRSLREVDQAVPVIVISGAAEAEGQYRGLEVTFRTKPLMPDEMIALVSSAIKKAA